MAAHGSTVAALRKAFEIRWRRFHRRERRRARSAPSEIAQNQKPKIIGRAGRFGCWKSLPPAQPRQRFSRHSRSRAASSLPITIRASEPPMKRRRLVEFQPWPDLSNIASSVASPLSRVEPVAATKRNPAALLFRLDAAENRAADAKQSAWTGFGAPGAASVQLTTIDQTRRPFHQDQCGPSRREKKTRAEPRRNDRCARCASGLKRKP